MFLLLLAAALAGDPLVGNWTSTQGEVMSLNADGSAQLLGTTMQWSAKDGALLMQSPQGSVSVAYSFAGPNLILDDGRAPAMFYPSPAVAPLPVYVPDNSVAETVEMVKLVSANNGFSLVSDGTYAFDYGYIPFALPMEHGRETMVFLIRRESTPFSAKVKGWGTDTQHFTPMYPPPPGTFVLTIKVMLGDVTDTSPQVVVSADGGDQGDVRVLVFAK